MPHGIPDACDVQEAGRERPSAILLRVARQSGSARVTFGELVHALGARSFGLLLLLLGLAAWIPIAPPGVATVFGLGLLAVAVQLLAGRPEPWLPRRLAAVGFERSRFAGLVERAAPWLSRAESWTRPRLPILFRNGGRSAVALWLIVLALAICVPLPMTNAGPGLAVVIMALGLIESDGVIVVVGAILGLLALAFMVVFWTAAWIGFNAMWG